MTNENSIRIQINAPTESEPTNIFGSILTSATLSAYITNDLEAAIDRFQALGMGPWSRIDGPASDESSVRASFAFMTGQMIELIQPSDQTPSAPPDHQDPELFDANIRAEKAVWQPVGGDGLIIEFHHAGAFMRDVETEVILSAANEAGLETQIMRGRAPGDIVMVDTRETLGHWLKVHTALYPSG
jgi:Glyoxalase/Bleomycin resistance protein/Dioxygenase superfamily